MTNPNKDEEEEKIEEAMRYIRTSIRPWWDIASCREREGGEFSVIVSTGEIMVDSSFTQQLRGNPDTKFRCISRTEDGFRYKFILSMEKQ